MEKLSESIKKIQSGLQVKFKKLEGFNVSLDIYSGEGEIHVASRATHFLPGSISIKSSYYIIPSYDMNLFIAYRNKSDGDRPILAIRWLMGAGDLSDHEVMENLDEVTLEAMRFGTAIYGDATYDDSLLLPVLADTDYEGYLQNVTPTDIAGFLMDITYARRVINDITELIESNTNDPLQILSTLKEIKELVEKPM